MFLQQAAEAAMPTTVLGIGFTVVGALVGAVGLLFKQLLAAKDALVASKDEGAKAVLAERAATTAILAPLVENVGKLAAAVNEQTGQARELRAVNERLVAAVDRQTETTTRLVERVMESRRSTSSPTQGAVR
jgi:hypothetical protein